MASIFELYKAEFNAYLGNGGTLEVKTGDTTKRYEKINPQVGGCIIGFFQWLRQNPDLYDIAFRHVQENERPMIVRKYVDEISDFARPPHYEKNSCGVPR